MSHDLFHLPLADPVMIFALAMVVFVSVPLLFERFRVPGIIGLIVAGAVVGPNGLALLERNETIVLLGTVGLLYLMFMAGVEAIIGAFLAGLAINRLVPESGPLNNRLHFFGNALFVPFFLFSVGMLVDVRVLAGSAQAWRVMVGMTLTVIVTKWLAARIAQRLFGYSADEGWMMFGLSVPQAAATLAAALIGYQIQLFDDAVLNGAILMILVTCTLGPWVVERYGRRLALREAREPYRPGDAPQRILVAISNPASAEPLVDLALLVRDPDSAEPVHPLIVVPGKGEEDGAIPQVAAAEKLLARAVIHGAGADVPMVPLTRVDHNYANGITRGITETRSNTVVVGWDRRRSRRFGLTGGMVERITERMQQLLLVARLAPPINTASRMVVVLPPCSERSRGFCDAIRTLKIMANRLGAEIVGLVIEGNCTDYESIFHNLKPDVPTRFQPVDGWRTLLPTLKDTLRPDDLVVVVSARPGTIAWSRTLERLPWHLDDEVPNSFVVVYPSETELEPQREPSALRLPGAIEPDRVVLGLPRAPFQQTLEQLVGEAVPDDAELRSAVWKALVRRELDGATELVPGVVAPNARVEGLRSPALVVGLSAEGVEFPEATAPAYLILLVLTPADQPQEHMKRLAELARLACSSEWLQELLGGVDADHVLERFRTDARRPQAV
jgi:mannitol/fructose-specific phosphotransferase system IIA component (Ntr-type)